MSFFLSFPFLLFCLLSKIKDVWQMLIEIDVEAAGRPIFEQALRH